MTQENRTQETPTLAPEQDELTAAELTLMVGGGDGPGSPGDNTGVLSGKATPILM